MTDFGMPGGESNKFVYEGHAGTHKTFDGTDVPWQFKRVWHLEPSLTYPDAVLAGVEDAAIFESKDAGKTWAELPGLRGHGTGPDWQPGAGGMCLHTIIVIPRTPSASSRRSRPQAHFAAMTVERVGSRSTRACAPNSCPLPRPKLATACTESRSIRVVLTRFSCRSITISCAATTRATRGTR